MVATRLVHDHASFLRQAVELERGEEHMQQARVVAVLDVFDVELPVVGQGLRETADDLHRLVHHTFDALADFGAEVVPDVGHVVRKTAEHQAGVHGNAQLARAVFFLAEVRRHAALTLDAFFERHTRQVALAVVAPCVVDTLEVVGLAGFLQRNERAAVRAAVFKGIDFAVRVAHHHHRRGASERGAVAALVGQICVQAQEVPGVAAENLRLFFGRHIQVAVERIGDAGERIGAPVNGLFLHVGFSYSSVTLALLMTLFHFSDSAWMNLPVCSGDQPRGSAPCSANLTFTSGMASASAMDF